tara:strand:+ start:230 stop:1162 length:933 start_codon:yes stop_codon:yes gene_type:complete
MIEKNPSNQTKLFGLDKYLLDLIGLFKNDKLPSKLLLSGQKGIGKSTLAYHLINFILSENEEFSYNLDKFEINPKNHSFITLSNKSNINFFIIDMNSDNKSIDINQIRELKSKLSKSSFNDKPRFVLIDNIEHLNINSINALLKILEEPTLNLHFILINNNKKVLRTLLSRCINYKISLSNKDNLEIANKLLNQNVNTLINKDLLNYYFSPGDIYRLVKFGTDNDYNLKDMSLNDLLKTIITNNHYKKDIAFRYLFFDLIEFYFSKFRHSMALDIHNKYNYFLKRISDTKKFNLDEESLLIEFEDKLLNG